MINFSGHYFDGKLPVSHPGSLMFDGQQVVVRTERYSNRFDSGDLKVSPRIGSTARHIALPDGGQFTAADDPFWNTLAQDGSVEGVVAWLEKRLGVALACVLVVAGLLLAGYFFGLPVAAKHAVKRIPMETEVALGEQVLTWFRKHQWIKYTELKSETDEDLHIKLYDLTKELPLKNYYRLEVCRSELFGANAFALPGGIILITDEMYNLAETEEELLAVLAHEVGHVELRHTMRIVLQNSILAIGVATVTADIATLKTAIAGLPMLLARMKYSRNFEYEADEYAFRLLRQNGHSPSAFASIMARLSDAKPGTTGVSNYLSSHPRIDERIQRARAMAAK